MQIDLQHLCLFKPFSVRQLRISPSYNSLSLFYTFLQSLNPLSLTPCVPFAVSIWDLQAVVCQQQSSKETGAPRVATGKGHQWVKNVNIQPSSGHSHGETGMKITPITQHRQGETTEDREGRDRLWMRERVRWTQLLKSWAKKKLKGELERKINLKISSKKQKKYIQQNREKGNSVCMCVFLDMCMQES